MVTYEHTGKLLFLRTQHHCHSPPSPRFAYADLRGLLSSGRDLVRCAVPLEAVEDGSSLGTLTVSVHALGALQKAVKEG